ncbi:hypothetical protein CP97_11995 [Aurantiacibacter atlanticus]|uniref:DUF2849 domain-containing protein n=1 Tax=Aurantiacibacter atlanticus TaxID=1648404 RepID=A0A0H4VD15_9SPHN|nr:DUF2849 domain-containing protein [Aurantiacibacter atlanticus]AKQ42602.1 hypothetical protein CP97_11995 [Aurantiacibacter atlanticus]MDF1834895.1 DUF2849 domain-containing protein [Alteraurantiacibacter sp. bin_em_oilr2.035]
MKILTGNDLKSGAVVWWNGQGWTTHITDAVDAGEEAESIMAREESARRVNSVYSIAAELTDNGPRPAHIKDRVRALGPTVRPDLAMKAAEEKGWDWVI